MTSKERILAVLRREPTDRLPLCFEGICHGVTRFLCDRLPDSRERTQWYLDHDVDAAAALPLPPVSREGFETRAWREDPPEERHPLIGKEYVTAAGVLRQVVRWTDDYDRTPRPTGTTGEVRLFSDHNVPPGRSKVYLVEGPRHLPALAALLQPIRGDERRAFLARARELRRFGDDHGVLLAGCLQGVGDPLFWMSGIQPVLIWAMEEPDFLAAYAAIVARWNRANLELLIEAGMEYVVRRGWYESADFWSPTLQRQFLLGPLKAEADLARQAGVVYAYCMNSGIDPLVDALAESGIDVLCNVDPTAARTDLAAMKSRLGATVTLCGGVNNQHVLERGTPADVRAAVAAAAETLAPGGGFILAPSDSILDTGHTARRNFHLMIEAWRQLGS